MTGDFSGELSIDARQETRIVCTEMKLKRAEEKIDPITGKKIGPDGKLSK